MYFFYIIEKLIENIVIIVFFYKKKMRYNVYFVKNEMMCYFEIYVIILVIWLGLYCFWIVFREYDLVIMCKVI